MIDLQSEPESRLGARFFQVACVGTYKPKQRLADFAINHKIGCDFEAFSAIFMAPALHG